MSRPTLSLCILTKDSGSRMRDLLLDGRRFADEILVGVDAASSDETESVAAGLADVVFRFEHAGVQEHARLLLLEFASAEWVLALDDDERMDSAFGDLRAELLSDLRYTHYWFPRKWLTQLQPPAHLDALPWLPDWQLRLFRNDRKLVWASPRLHDPYMVIGMGCREDRTAIVHYERVIFDEDVRRRKMANRRNRWGASPYDEFYGSVSGVPTSPLENPPMPVEAEAGARAPARVVEGIHSTNRSLLPPWSAELSVPTSRTECAGRRFLVEVTAINRGDLRWVPPQEGWPRLFLSYHLRDVGDEVRVWDGERTPVARVVDPGEPARFYAEAIAPDEQGDYILEWDLVSEGECWFSECGSMPARTALRVVPDERAPARRRPSRLRGWRSALQAR